MEHPRLESNQTPTVSDDRWGLCELQGDIYAVKTLANLIDDLVFEDRTRDEADRMIAEERVLVLFDSLRARLDQANARIQALLDLEHVRGKATPHAPAVSR